MEELTSKLGLSIKFGLAADLTIKKLIEEKKMPLSDSLIKAATWTHNTSISKLGYLPLQLGKEVTLPSLTTGTEVSESMSGTVAWQRTLENLTRIVFEFHEADMRRKLKECQGIPIHSYQHL